MTAPAEFDPRSWAAAQLEVRPDASLAEIRDALRRRLADDDFVPPLSVQQAAEILLRQGEGNRGNQARAQARLEEEQRLWAEIDEFAGEFFDLPPEKRRQWWQTLQAAGAFSPLLVARLRALEPGLTVSVPTQFGPDVSELIRHVCNLFVLRPTSRAALRHSLTRRMGEDVPRWQAAGRVLWKHAPAVARLVPDFTKCVAYNLAQPSQEEGHKNVTLRKAPATSEVGKLLKGLPWAILWGFLIMMCADSNHSSSTKNTAPQRPTQPPLTIPKDQYERWQQFLRDQEKLKPGPNTERDKERMEQLLKFLAEEERRKLGLEPGRRQERQGNGIPDRPKPATNRSNPPISPPP